LCDGEQHPTSVATRHAQYQPATRSAARPDGNQRFEDWMGVVLGIAKASIYFDMRPLGPGVDPDVGN
jgi:hypothetical protein